MNSAALKEAVATGYPREKMFGVWWSAGEPDVKDLGDAAKGYSGLVATGDGGKILDDIKGIRPRQKQGTGPGRRAQHRCFTCAGPCQRRARG
jgi:branched-chain amino acid transport system substrate-binding protein